MNSFSLVLVAAGSSVRMGRDKLLLELAGATVTERSLSAFSGFPELTERIVVTSNPEIRAAASRAAERDGVRVVFAEGGKSRSESVQNGLALASAPYVLVHDGARPFVQPELIRRILDDTARYGSAVPSLPLNDSVRVAGDGELIGAADRASFYRVQTPQGYRTEELRRACRAGMEETDESGLLLLAGVKPHLTEGAESNRKLTRPEDVFGFGTRVGIGYDVHRLVEGRKLMLGGVEIPYRLGEEAHSDGDVLLHAVMDALLSAAGEKDIGQRFSDKDLNYKDISSVILLKEVAAVLREKGLTVASISAVVALTAPKLAAFIPRMVETIRTVTRADFVNVSATTTENLGVVGAGGVAAYAVAAVLP